MREALRQLVASGLVDARAHRGAVVAHPDSERLAGMFEAMAELEALCAGMAAERMTASERHALQSLHDQLRAISHLGDPQRFHEINEAFHNAIYAGAHNAYLAELALATRKRVQPFRRAQFRNVGRLAKSHAEHDRVVLAIQQGDRTAATAAMRAHIDTVRKEYATYAGKVSRVVIRTVASIVAAHRVGRRRRPSRRLPRRMRASARTTIPRSSSPCATRPTRLRKRAR